MSGHGLHKLSGGIAKREREAWEGLPTSMCPLKGCGQPAVALVDTAFQGPRPICETHIDQAIELGYRVRTAPDVVLERDDGMGLER